MYDGHRTLKTPPDDTTLWRYLSLESLVAMLYTRRIHFTRLDKFQDPWEGTWPQPILDAFAGAPADGVRQILDETRTSVHVNCWHESNYESAALWDIYSGSAGIAIQSSVGQVKVAIDPTVTFHIGRVEYTDYTTLKGGAFDLNGSVLARGGRRGAMFARFVNVLVNIHR